jgi:DNA-binding CsgD family transcriptional regulator
MIAQRMHAVSLESWALSLRVERYTLFGRLSDAIRIGTQAVGIDSVIGQGTILPRSHAFLGCAYAAAGQMELAEQQVGIAERLVAMLHKTELRTVVVATAARTFLDFLEGRYTQTVERITALMPRLLHSEPLHFYALHPFMLPLAAEAAARAGHTAVCHALLERIQTLRQGSGEAMPICVQGLLLLDQGQAAQARDLFEQTIGIAAQQGRLFDKGRMLLDLAEACDRLNDPDAAARALTLAVETFSYVGAERLRADAAQRLRQRGIKPIQAVPLRTAGQPISGREMDVARLIAAGKSNKEIARALFVSVLTVETHVRNILRKLGMKSRVQIAGYALGFDRV